MKNLKSIHEAIQICRSCKNMCGSPVYGLANQTEIMLIGQAPGPHEADLGKPFAYTAGKTLFAWLNSVTDLSEEELREKIYFAAVARCFPGKAPSGGDREPSREEIKNCRVFLKSEVEVLRPKLILAVGKLAISEILRLPKSFKLKDVIGKKFFIEYHSHPVHVIPLPHPSGISTWHKSEEGKKLLNKALGLVSSTGGEALRNQ